MEEPQLPGAWRAAVVAAVALLVILVTVVLPASGGFEIEQRPGFGRTTRGTVVAVVEERVEDTPLGEALVRVVEVGVEDQRVVVTQQLVGASREALAVEAGDRVLINASPGPNGEVFSIVDRVRLSLLLGLAAIFALLVTVVGGWKGARSLLGLGLSFLVLARFIVPAILNGQGPLLVALIGSITIMAATFSLSHGVQWRSIVALAGTAAALLLTVLLAQATFAAAHLTGLADEDAATAAALFAGLDPRGLLVAGFVIGTLGVLDDVAMAQASTVFELRRANVMLSTRDLFSRGMVVGRDHIASTVNTLVLAYAGASLPVLLILFTAQGDGAGVLINRELLAVEVLRTLVGSIGIVAAVPFTTAIAAGAASRFHVSVSEGGTFA